MAKRLGVGEGAVQEALAKMPTLGAAPIATAPTKKTSALLVSERGRHAFALLLWQEGMPKPAIDVAAFRKELEEAIGREEMQRIESIPESERESFRFTAEELYGTTKNLQRTANDLLKILTDERIRGELREVRLALEEAERGVNTEQISHLEERSRLLTDALARLHKKE